MRKSLFTGAAVGVIAALMLTGCSSLRFIANGSEFKKICTNNGLQVQEASATVNANKTYGSLTDAYLATAADGTYSIWYVRFSDTGDAQKYYDSIAGQLSGKTYSGSNYQAEVETVNDKSREIYMESGRIIYADGTTSAINALENQLIGTWSGSSSSSHKTGAAGTSAGTQTQ